MGKSLVEGVGSMPFQRNRIHVSHVGNRAHVEQREAASVGVRELREILHGKEHSTLGRTEGTTAKAEGEAAQTRDLFGLCTRRVAESTFEPGLAFAATDAIRTLGKLSRQLTLVFQACHTAKFITLNHRFRRHKCASVLAGRDWLFVRSERLPMDNRSLLIKT